MNRAFIIDNPTVVLGPDPADTPGTALTVTCDLTRAEITNNVNMVDTGTLCGPASQPGKIEYTLELDGYQSWDDPTSANGEALAAYLWRKQRVQVPFKLLTKNAPVGLTNPIFEGTCVCVPPEVGGTREEAAVFTCALPIIGTPTQATTGTLPLAEGAEATQNATPAGGQTATQSSSQSSSAAA